MRIVWTAPALRDLAAVRDFIGLDNPAAAARQVGFILGAVASLARHPEIARAGRLPGTRELVVGNTPFLLPYRVRDEAIEVLRVLHGRQRWPERV